MTTRERLRAHLKSKRITQRDFARIVGITPVGLAFVLNGRRSPGRDLALDIETATSGRIKARDWSKDNAVQAA